MSVVAASASVAERKTDASIAEKMCNEADNFLSAIPSDQADIWVEAINLAIDGDNSKLQQVRHGRNKQPQIPANVETDSLSPGIVLFRSQHKSEAPLPLLIYLHGGGWTVGSINSCSRFCAAIASTGKAMVAAIDYPLAPEHPYPEGLDFITEAIDKIWDNASDYGSSPELVSIGGDSSGGNLAIASTMLRPDKIRSMILFYPVTLSDRETAGSWTEYGSVVALPAKEMDVFNRAYRTERQKTEPHISPLTASDEELSALPQTMIIGAERDILRDQGSAFCDRLRVNGIAVDHEVFPGTVHLFITVPGQPTAFQCAVDRATAFLSDWQSE